MKIDYVIVSCDDNPTYFDFWDVVKKLWFELVGIKPILVHITDNDEIVNYGDYIIHNIKSVEGVDTGFQSQVARMYVTKFYKNYVCLTSDIDMLPLSKNYYTSDITEYDDNSLLIFSSDAYSNINRYPICYNAAKGSLFDEILGLDDTFEKYVKKLLSLNWGWDTDELFFGMKVNQYPNQNKIIKLNRRWFDGVASKRIDRCKWVYNIDDLRNHNYIDSHSLRPYLKYKQQIDLIVNSLI